MTVQRFAALAFRTGNMLQNAAIATAIPGTGTQQRLQMLLQMGELDNLGLDTGNVLFHQLANPAATFWCFVCGISIE